MRRDNVDDLRAFIAVARERSFTKAAAQLGVSQSALSYTIRTLEARLGLRLLTRTTRSVSLTEAGERLLGSIGPRFDDIEREVAALSALRNKPAGTVRITAVEHAAQTILWPALARLLPEYPDINVEIINDYAITDIVAERYDAGVRLGEQVDKDMIAVRIGPDLRMAVVAAASYFDGRSRPLVPQDLTEQACIALRLPTHGGLHAWEFRNSAQEVKVRVQGRAVFNTLALMRQAALDGLGIAYLPEDLVDTAIQQGQLVRVLADWCPSRPGYHLYHPSRREPSPAFALVVQALRHHDSPHAAQES
jgi:DNA-binding transcriptional LysR family regulator